jgi:glycerol-3-phosphate acyltransferase PlsY
MMWRAACVGGAVAPRLRWCGMFYVWLVVCYLAGAMPWSVWLGHWLFQVDPRAQVDGNPGTANAFRSGGLRLGIPVLLLELSKGAIPVLLASRALDASGADLFWLGLMPVLGHAFSPFLGLRGGRGIAAMYGVWFALSGLVMPLVISLGGLVALFVTKSDDVRGLFLPGAALAFCLVTRAQQWMIALAGAQLLLYAIKAFSPNPGHARASSPLT